ncbi:hypothetical protein C7271_10155 [filamentous cyanobacterium CCP5]|nr:hypothetical protein C7271_10155 [filamentous cyanobacterium CCP5]
MALAVTDTILEVISTFAITMTIRWPRQPHSLIIAFLAGLVVIQLAGLGMWRLVWPIASPVELSFVVSLDEANDWRPLIDQFQTQNPDIRLRLVE